MFDGKSIVPLAIVAVAAGVGLTRAAERGDDGTILEAGTMSAFEIQIGDCFDDEAFSSGEISELPLWDISASVFPGDDEVDMLATNGCYERFEASIGKSYEESVIDFTTMYPSSGSWANGDREVVCIGYHMEMEKLTTTVIASGR
jgi:hypothetical protein